MAFPPISPAVLSRNKGFEQFIGRLKKECFNEDGSRKDDNDRYDGVEEEVRRLREDVLREEILLRALRQIVFEGRKGEQDSVSGAQRREVGEEISGKGELANGKEQEMSWEVVRQALRVVVNVLDAEKRGVRLSPEDWKLLAPDLEAFKLNMEEISAAVGQVLMESQEDVLEVVQLGVASVNPVSDTSTAMTDAESSRLIAVDRGKDDDDAELDDLTKQTTQISLNASKRTGKPLTNATQTLLSHRDTITRTAPQTQEHIVNAHTTLLILQSQMMEAKIRDLELYQHGTRARYLTSRATFLSTVAKGMDLKAKVLELEVLKDIAVGKGGEGVRRKLEDRRREVEMLEKETRGLTELWTKYEECKVDSGGKTGKKGEGLEVMKVLGKRYGEVEKDIGKVKEDLESLRAKMQDSKKSKT